MLRNLLLGLSLTIAALVATPVLAQTATAEPVVAVSSIVAPSSVAVGTEFTATLTVSSPTVFASAEFTVSTSEGITFVSVKARDGIVMFHDGDFAWLAPTTGKTSAMELIFYFHASGSGTRQINFSDAAFDEGVIVAESVTATINVMAMVQRAGVITYGPRTVPVDGVEVVSVSRRVPPVDTFTTTTNFAGAYSLFLPYDPEWATALRFSKVGDVRGALTVSDALIVLRCSLHMAPTLSAEFEECNEMTADTSRDGSVSALDAWQILSYSAGNRNPTQIGTNVANWIAWADSTEFQPMINNYDRANGRAWIVGDVNYSWGETPDVVAADAACSTSGITFTPSDGVGEYLLKGVSASSVMIDLSGVPVQEIVADGWMAAINGDKIAMIAGSGAPTPLNVMFTIAPEQGVTELDARVSIDDCPSVELSSALGFIELTQSIFLPYTIR